jgi:hypothetical protein
MSNKELYKKICKEKTGVPLFMQPWWLDVVCRSWDVAIAKKGEEVTGVWAYPIEKKAGVTLLRNPMLTPYLGPQVFYPNGLKESNLDSFEHETVAELLKQLPDANVWHLALQPGMKQVGLFKNNELKPHAQQTFLLELNEDEETLFANMKETARRNIRMAEKEITVSNSPEDLKELYKFQKEILTKKGTPQAYSFSYIQKIMEACIANNAAALWVAKKEGETQAIVWQVWDDKCSYYFMGGQNQESNSYKAMSLLLWHAIKEAKKRGHTTFDLEGSMDEGVERFFRNFGGERALYIVLHKNDSLLWKIKQMVFR